MLRFGITRPETILDLSRRKKAPGGHVSMLLLDWKAQTGLSFEQRVEVFESVCFRLRTSSGIYRTSYRNRFEEIDLLMNGWLQKSFAPNQQIRIDDRAVSHALTSAEWMQKLLPNFSGVEYEASDILLFLVHARSPYGEDFVLEPDGKPLQLIEGNFVLPLDQPEHPILALNRWKAANGKQRLKELHYDPDWFPPETILEEGLTAQMYWRGWTLKVLPLVHPEALNLSQQNKRFRIRQRSVFSAASNSVEIVRTMNILNLAYFSEQQLRDAGRMIFDTLTEGGLWLIGRTLEEPLFETHATLFQKQNGKWKRLERVRRGSEAEALILS